MSLTPSPVPSLMPLNPFAELLIFIMFFESKISIGSSLYLLFLSLNFLFVEPFFSSFCFKHVYNCSLKYFDHNCLKISDFNNPATLISVSLVLIHFEIFLALGLMHDNQLQPGHFPII